MTRIVRRATPADFRAIYGIQNGSFRMEVFDSSPDSFEEFSAKTVALVEGGVEHYFVLEEDSQVTGFVWFSFSDDLWFTTIWGRWLKTLVYAAGVTGFDCAKISKQIFLVRQSNKRMIRVAEEAGYGFRKAGETSGYIVRDEFPHLVVV